MHFSTALVLSLLAAAPALALNNDPDQAEAVILKDDKAQDYCWDLLNKTPKPKTSTVTKTATTTKVTKTATDTDDVTTTKTVDGKTVTVTKTVGTDTKTVTSTSKGGAVTTFIKMKRSEPTPIVMRRASEPSSLKQFTNSAVSKGCSQAYTKLNAETTKTVTSTSTKNVATTVTKTETHARTTTKADKTTTDSDTATVTKTKTVATPSATVTAFAFAIRSRSSGSKSASINIGSNNYLTTKAGDDSYALFVKTGSSGGFDKGYFQDAADTTQCLKEDTYINAYLYFAPCGSRPATFYVEKSSGFNYVSSSADAEGVVSSGGMIYLTDAKDSPALSWTAGNS